MERPADAQFWPISDYAQGRADLFESGCSMSEQEGPCPLPQMVQAYSIGLFVDEIVETVSLSTFLFFELENI